MLAFRLISFLTNLAYLSVKTMQKRVMNWWAVMTGVVLFVFQQLLSLREIYLM